MIDLEEKMLVKMAWEARESAFCKKTKVGAAVLCFDGNIYSGCNIEHDFCKSIHAEVCAISQLVSNGHLFFERILIVSDIPNFYPCGGCMDWIMQHGPKAKIACSHDRNEPLVWLNTKRLMPFYPYK